MPLRTIRDVLRQVPNGTPVSLTGGEPFLYEEDGCDLADVVAVLDPGSRPVSIISSGWEPGEEPYESVFSRLIHYFPALEIGTSFHLYQKAGMEERVKALLRRVASHGGNSWINVVVSQTTAGLTVRRLAAMLRELSLTPEDPRAVLRLSDHENSSKPIRFHSETGNRVVVQPMKLQAVGRARSLSEPLFVDHEDCGFLTGETRMAISVTGDVYMCESPSTMDGPGLGNINQESVIHVLERFDRFRAGLSSALRLGRHQYHDICRACVALRGKVLDSVQ